MYSDVCGCRLVGGDSGGRGGECTVTVCGCRSVGEDSGGIVAVGEENVQ